MLSGSDRLHKFDYRMIDKAIEVAHGSDFRHFKTGCVITYKGHIISMAHNVEKTTPAQKRYNRLRKFNNDDFDEAIHKTHAEILAIQKIGYTTLVQTDWGRANIYIARIALGLPGGIGLAKPCPACMQAIKDLGIRNLFYTGDDCDIVYERR